MHLLSQQQADGQEGETWFKGSLREGVEWDTCKARGRRESGRRWEKHVGRDNFYPLTKYRWWTPEFCAIINKKKTCKKWTYNFMTCEIELPLSDFYFLVGNEELCHLRQGWGIKAPGRRGIRPVWLESRRPWVPGQALCIWASPAEAVSFVNYRASQPPGSMSLSPIINTCERQDLPLKSAAWES